MKGLLIKDLCLLRNQKKLLPIFLILAVWFTAFDQNDFAFPFLAMMASVVSLSTMSYDEADHSRTHLFTLPFDRREYVTEKFLLGGVLLVSSQVLAFVCAVVRTLAAGDGGDGENVYSLLLSLCAGVIMLSLMIPVRIRFGSDQGRLILYAVFAAVFVGCGLLLRLMPADTERLPAFLSGSMSSVLALSAAAAVVLGAAGYLLSVRWLRVKEF